jgi:hypothetical protein
MANPLLYNAIDQYLYIDTQLDARTDQAAREETRRTSKKTTVQCCICCWCCCEAAVQDQKSPLGLDLARQLQDEPYNLSLWNEIPNIAGTCIQNNGGAKCQIPDDVYVIWVCDTSGSNSSSQPTGCGAGCSDRSGYDGCYYRCGNQCSWTVPAGVSKVQFDAWGPGSGSWGATCCGGSPWGSTGAFMSVTMNVTPGDTYCLKSGCAVCCGIQAYPNFSQMHFPAGCATCMCGPGMCNIYIGPGNPQLISYVWLRAAAGGFNVACCAGNLNGGSGQCWCNAGYHCFDNSCSTCGVMGGIPSGSYAQGCISGDRGFAYKIPGLFGVYCLDNNNYGYYQAAPVPRFECNSQWCFTFTSNACGGCNCSCTVNPQVKIPGQGGFPVHVMSGCCICGARGNMGAIRIAYKCC